MPRKARAPLLSHYAAAKGTAAALVVAGGALLGGCAQSPAYAPAYYQPVPSRYVDLAASAAAMRAYIEQQNAWARQYYDEPDDAPVMHPAPRPFNVHPAAANNGVAMPSAALPPIAPPRPAAPPAASSDCVGWWRICHFL